MAEWFKALILKINHHYDVVGSNPTLPVKKKKNKMKKRIKKKSSLLYKFIYKYEVDF